MSQNNLGFKEERDVKVAMRDGVKVAVDIFRPEVAGKYPALLSMSPYGKGLQSLDIIPHFYNAISTSRSIEAGDPRFFVAHGYVHVVADVRGTGHSEGEYGGFYSKQEAQDGYDLVEWIASQPWCDGNVGMAGISYFGGIQLMVAAQQPPHLKAIMPWNAIGDFYREGTHHGGLVQTFLQVIYTGSIAAEKSTSWTMKKYPREQVDKMIERALQDPDVRSYPDIYRYLDNPGKNPCWFDALINSMDGEYYWERSPYRYYEKIKIPFYTSSAWWAYAHIHLFGGFNHFTSINAPKKLVINGPMEEDKPLPLEYNIEVVRWYDHWLKGKNSGIINEPPVKLFVRGIDRWRFENEWPLARTKWTKYYLRSWEKLETEPELLQENKFDCYAQQPLGESLKIQTLNYLTAPFEKDTEFTGPLALYLQAAIDQDDTSWLAYICDVAPNGSETELTAGFLKASHRELDEGKSKPYYPYHPHLREEKVVPGNVYEYAIALAPLSNVFRTGHQLKLVVASMDSNTGKLHRPWHMCHSKTTVHKVYHDARRQSHLVLPVV